MVRVDILGGRQRARAHRRSSRPEGEGRASAGAPPPRTGPQHRRAHRHTERTTNPSLRIPLSCPGTECADGNEPRTECEETQHGRNAEGHDDRPNGDDDDENNEGDDDAREMGEMLRQIRYKAEWYGRTWIEVGRDFPSSGLCSTCGTLNPNLTVDEIRWTCEECATTHDRHENAAVNIEAEGLRTLIHPEDTRDTDPSAPSSVSA